MNNDILKVGDQELGSRLFLGTGKFSSTQAMIDAVKASGTELVTVALRRFNREQAEDDLYGPLSELENVKLMPNTSGAMNAKEAVTAAVLGREISKSPSLQGFRTELFKKIPSVRIYRSDADKKFFSYFRI